MAISVKRHAVSEEGRVTDFRFDVIDFTGDASYPTGGTPGVASSFGFTRILALWPVQHSGYILDYLDTDRLKIYQQPAAAAAGASPEVPNTTNLSAVPFRVAVIGL